MASTHPPPLIGAVFERAPASTPSTPFAPASKTGFPQAPHRSKKSAFQRAREAAGASSSLKPRDHVPVVVPFKREASRPSPSDEQPTKDPDDWRAQMSRENELRVSAMTDEEREEERREILEKFGPGLGDVLKKVREARATSTAPLPSALTTPSSTRPASRASKQLRFAEVTENDVHVYESAPPSPRKKALALPAPSADDNGAVSLGQWTGVYSAAVSFPPRPRTIPDLEWMQETMHPVPSAPPPADALRFDLTGNPLAAPLHASLPTHLGLHHHAPDSDGLQRAGYTLDDSQRAAGMRMLAGVARWVGAVHRGDADLPDGVMKASEIGDVKTRVRGALGVHAIEVVWECVEELDPDVEPDMEGVELGSKDTFPTAQLLPQIVAALSTQVESPDSSVSARILAILHRLARQTNDIATEIVSTPDLIPSLFRAYLMTDAANPACISLLTTLASSTHALLRFVTTLPPPDPALLTETLSFYTALAATAHLQIAALTHLIRAWASLLEIWLTTPAHEILWSQVVAWGWNDDFLALHWGAWAAWLEAERAESVAASEGAEHAITKAAIDALTVGLNDFGRGGAMKLKNLGSSADVLMAGMRLWLACLPAAADGPLSAPPFGLPFAQLSDLCAKLVAHPLWARLPTSGASYVLFRPLASLLSRLPDVASDVWMAQALTVLARLLPGDEIFALQIGQEVLALVTPEWTRARGLGLGGGVGILTPFLARACATPASIKHATTLRLPTPAARDWALSPLDHLLRSGTSPVFSELPAGWDAAALLLANVARAVCARFSFRDFVLTGEEAVWGCMKSQPQGAEREVFRDGVLLAPFTAAASTSSTSPEPCLAKVAAVFLGPSTPFYQYYTDFVALYDAVSFANPTFARLLLPPTAMGYADGLPATAPADVIVGSAGGLGAWLWPVETDAGMLAAYLRALVNGAGCMDLCGLVGDASCGAGEERAEKLLRVVLDQGGNEVIREVVQVELPPKCFELGQEEKKGRLEFTERIGGEAFARRIEALLQ
ncbi:hypothetical protein DFH06DRAFT_1235276 [Mycena polygramma]|nr:hypothetical protein DFH06DRAFT_1235276 [Mycena polygramma]